MFEDDVTVAAGWYPDPMGLPQLRWWNNHAWTELTTEARPPLVMQQPAPTRVLYADDELPTRRQQREQREREEEYVRLATDEGDERDAAAAYAPLTNTLREIDPPAAVAADDLATVPESAAQVADFETPSAPADAATDLSTRGQPAPAQSTPAQSTPAQSAPDRTGIDEGDAGVAEAFNEIFQPRSATTAVSAPTAQYERTRTADPEEHSQRTSSLPHLPPYTAAVWIIALLPLLQLVVGLMVIVGFSSIASTAFTIGSFAIPYVVVILLAAGDRALLRRAGHDHTAHWAWAFLSAPVYLVVRSIALSRTGNLGLGPLLVWAALGFMQLVSVLVVPGMLISLAPATFSAQAQQSVQSEATILGAKLDVTCPPAPPLLVGQQFTCKAVADTGKSYNVVVSLQRANGWINWRVDDWGSYTLAR